MLVPQFIAYFIQNYRGKAARVRHSCHHTCNGNTSRQLCRVFFAAQLVLIEQVADRKGGQLYSSRFSRGKHMTFWTLHGNISVLI